MSISHDDLVIYVLLILTVMIPLGAITFALLFVRMTRVVVETKRTVDDTHKEVNSQMEEFRRLVTQEAHNLVTRQLADIRAQGVAEGKLQAREEARENKKNSE